MRPRRSPFYVDPEASERLNRREKLAVLLVVVGLVTTGGAPWLSAGAWLGACACWFSVGRMS